ALLDSWFAECPYPRGLNWAASLEPAVRLVNWSFAWHLLGADDSIIFTGAEGRAFRARWLQSVYEHCHFIAGHESRYSSANNHLLGEAAGLLTGALTWPLWPQSGHWRDQAHAELSAEALKQTFSDGVNKEQALWYHHSVADILLIAGLIARTNGVDFAPVYWERLEAMLELIASVMDCEGNVPAFGDADDGILVPLAPESRPPVHRSLLATGAVLFHRPDFGHKAGSLDDKSRWLLGDDADEQFAGLEAERPLVRRPERQPGNSRAARPSTPRAEPNAPLRAAFPEGGYFILGEDFDSPREVRIVADAGPLGYLSIAAHGHADALAFTLSVAGLPILIDPGTFSYYGAPSWRHYFRGTSAHSTVTIDGEDQSSYRGSFLWLEHARASVEAHDLSGPMQSLTASHDGYTRLADPVRHQRTWRYLMGKRRLIVIDELLCRGAHAAAIHWHFAPECRVTVEHDVVVAERGSVRLRLVGPQGLARQIVSGQEHPPLGWYSPSFDTKVPSPTAVFTADVHGDTRLATEIEIEISTPARPSGA
ncbi:MAG: alginate lyase family protein, partial [Steroidobacteraceae bacterium]